VAIEPFPPYRPPQSDELHNEARDIFVPNQREKHALLARTRGDVARRRPLLPALGPASGQMLGRFLIFVIGEIVTGSGGFIPVLRTRRAGNDSLDLSQQQQTGWRQGSP